MSVYYNEFDKKKAAWLRELMKRDVIAPGVVDERSILDVRPGDLDGFSQCHFFAGIGIWSFALRNAGWPDSRPAWTGSCPCQPFSVAGEGLALEDERHLFPAWFGLIKARRPVAIFGEQVSDGDGLTWLDVVHAAMDSAGYTLGVVDTCAAGFGAPMRSQRLYFVAEAEEVGRRQECPDDRRISQRDRAEGRAAGLNAGCGTGNVAETDKERHERSGSARGRRRGSSDHSATRDMGQTDKARPQGQQFGRNSSSELALGSTGVAGPVNGFWQDADWIWCRDEKWRAVKPCSFPLAHGSPARVGRLRGYGDAIVEPQAREFIKAYLDIRG